MMMMMMMNMEMEIEKKKIRHLRNIAVLPLLAQIL